MIFAFLLRGERALRRSPLTLAGSRRLLRPPASAAGRRARPPCRRAPRLVPRPARSPNSSAFGTPPSPPPLRSRSLPRQATGISISDELLSLYEEVKLRHKHKYFSFSLQKTGQVGVKVTYDWRIDSKAEPSPDSENKSAFAAMIKDLPTDDARFIVFDFTESKDDGRQIKKLLLIKW